VCNVGKHSIHINDTQEETWRIASSVFNENSIHFLNQKNNLNTPKFDQLYDDYCLLIKNRSDCEDFCIDSSAVLSAYGLRDCRDLDFLHLKNIGNLNNEIECHNDWSHFYTTVKNEIIYNPINHFYFHGIKFASLEIIKNMKKRRNEEKDRKDVYLIGSMQ
jgi:hypothetical protein